MVSATATVTNIASEFRRPLFTKVSNNMHFSLFRFQIFLWLESLSSIAFFRLPISLGYYHFQIRFLCFRFLLKAVVAMLWFVSTLEALNLIMYKMGCVGGKHVVWLVSNFDVDSQFLVFFFFFNWEVWWHLFIFDLVNCTWKLMDRSGNIFSFPGRHFLIVPIKWVPDFCPNRCP